MRAAPVLFPFLAFGGLLWAFSGKKSAPKRLSGGGGGRSGLAWNPEDSVGEGRVTPLPPSVARDLISEAARQAGASDAQVAMLIAQSDVETATWQKMREWNFGNITVFPGGGKYWELLVDERIGGVWKKIVQHFKVWDSPELGARGFVGYIRSRPPLWQAADSGDPEVYGQALADAGYYTAEPYKYISALKSRMA